MSIGALRGVFRSTIKAAVARCLLHSRYYDAYFGRLKNVALVLMYHRISSTDDTFTDFETGVSAVHFEAQMRYIREHMNPIPLRELARSLSETRTLPPRAVAVTFDDGYADNYMAAYPVLQKYAVPATVFASSGPIGSGDIFWWDTVGEVFRQSRQQVLETAVIRRAAGGLIRLPRAISLSNRRERREAAHTFVEALKQLEHGRIASVIGVLRDQLGVRADEIDAKRHRMLSWSELHTMAGNGVEIGAHTVTHPDLARIRDHDALRREVSESKRQLEHGLGKRVDGFAYPFGLSQHYNGAVRAAVAQAG